ncbi:MAG: NADH:flavin oxidoreductase/NADH oxidase family protein [Chromatiales bacterium]|jgi:2,4-dienoyl-CoA reductase-like NADH-dependent reductase (Old Yellow Enzyme family)
MAGELERDLVLPCGAVITNRIGKSAMTEGLADKLDRATVRHQRLYRRWSEGGAGLLVTGNVMIDRRYLERPGNVVLEDREGFEQLRAWARAGTVGGNHLWMQINHPGRQATRMSALQPLAPSPVQLDILGLFGKPRAMQEADIEDVIRRFAFTAKCARETGFTGVQIHAAHGYLLSQFLSPSINRREDAWGGPLENRARLLLAVVAAVREAVGRDFPVAVKLNSADFQKGGFTLEECTQVASWLGDAGLDLLEISGGTYEQLALLGHHGEESSYEPPKRESTRRREAYFLDYATAIRAAATVPLMVTGGFRSRALMEQAIARNELDMIGIARPMCVDVDLPRRLLDADIDAAPSYEETLPLKGRWLGPTSPLQGVQFLNVQGEVAWFYRQLLKLADGLEPDRRLGILSALGRHLATESKTAWARRARRA